MEEDPTLDFGPYGLGTVRTIAQYERYIGVHFASRQVHTDAIQQLTPGQNHQSTRDWFNDLRKHFKHYINFHRNDLKQPDLTYYFFAVSFHDKDHRELYRHDVPDTEANNWAKSDKEWLTITREFYPASPPAYWVVWPVTQDPDGQNVWNPDLRIQRNIE
jgi:hypothetical protein